MIHARPDYNRIQDPAVNDRNLLPDLESTPIAEDEPVFLLRAHDKHFITMLRRYETLVIQDRSISDTESLLFSAGIHDHIELARVWQVSNGTKTPDLPSSSELEQESIPAVDSPAPQ